MDSPIIIGTATLLFAAIILIHELGHFVAAKLVGIKVITFSVGFGKRLWSKKIGETTFCIAAIPLGGFVLPARGPSSKAPEGHRSPKIMYSIGQFGDDEKRQIEESTTATSGTLAHASFWAKLFFYTNGLIFNLILALIVVFVQVYCFVDAREKNPDMQIATVFKSSPAAEAGLITGDRIIDINGKQNPTWADVAATWANLQPGAALSLSVQRADTRTSLSYVPGVRWYPKTKTMEPNIGFSAAMVPRVIGIGEALALSTRVVLETIPDILSTIVGSHKETREESGDSFGFVGGMVQLGVQASSSFEVFAGLFLVMSVAVVILNALPLPACDGSQILILLIETIKGNELPYLMKERISCCGLVLAFGMIGASIVADAVEVIARFVG